MSFAVVAWRAVSATPSSLYPVAGEANHSIEVDAADGIPRVHPVQSLRVVHLDGPSRPRRHRRVRVDGDVVLTDCRVAFVGTAAGRIAIRGRRGALLLGHVRYAWLIGVEVTSERRLFRPSFPVVGLRLEDPTGVVDEILLQVRLRGSTSAAEGLGAGVEPRAEVRLARDIAAAAATHRAGAPGVDEVARQSLLRFAAEPVAQTRTAAVHRYLVPQVSDPEPVR